MSNILVIGPHPDDQELGMGGTIIRLATQGHNVLLLDMTDGEPTPYGSPERREREAAAAAELMGVHRRRIGLKNRYVEHTIDARHRVAAVIREHQADMLFIPHIDDVHPDHMATTRIAEDARFDAKLSQIDLPGEPIYPKWVFYYFCTHLRMVANPSFCMDISDQIDLKERAILAYESQFIEPPGNRRVVEWLREMNGYMGSRIGTRYAEPFFAKEPLGLMSLNGIITNV